MQSQLAQLHAEFGIYKKDAFSLPDSQNIISRISSIPEIEYLHRFYSEYQKGFKAQFQKRSKKRIATKSTSTSRSNELPFVGESVIQSGHAKYMFVFQGSLQEQQFLSVTVLSCLWPLGDSYVQNDIFQVFWPGRKNIYEHIVKSLGITPAIANCAYVVNALRIETEDKLSDLHQNRDLLEREITLLDPELVVLLGGAASRTMGHNAHKERKALYRSVPFPTTFDSERNIRIANYHYKKLRKLWGA
jgi:hypothetical protein